MKNINQAVCDRIGEWDLPWDVQDVVNDTGLEVMNELFGDIKTPGELIAFVRENLETYDSFMVSAVFEGGATIDNDMVYEECDSQSENVDTELNVARDWFAEKDPDCYMVSYYKDRECVFNEIREA